jgi:hypothetical protein
VNRFRLVHADEFSLPSIIGEAKPTALEVAVNKRRIRIDCCASLSEAP